jgi:hypothetical protein
MKVLKMTSHALERLEQEFGMKPRTQLITEYCAKQPIITIEGTEYIKFNKGVFVVSREDNTVTLVTFIGSKRMGAFGKAVRAKAA